MGFGSLLWFGVTFIVLIVGLGDALVALVVCGCVVLFVGGWLILVCLVWCFWGGLFVCIWCLRFDDLVLVVEFSCFGVLWLSPVCCCVWLKLLLVCFCIVRLRWVWFRLVWGLGWWIVLLVLCGWVGEFRGCVVCCV